MSENNVREDVKKMIEIDRETYREYAKYSLSLLEIQLFILPFTFSLISVITGASSPEVNSIEDVVANPDSLMTGVMIGLISIGIAVFTFYISTRLANLQTKHYYHALTGTEQKPRRIDKIQNRIHDNPLIGGDVIDKPQSELDLDELKNRKLETKYADNLRIYIILAILGTLGSAYYIFTSIVGVIFPDIANYSKTLVVFAIIIAVHLFIYSPLGQILENILNELLRGVAILVNLLSWLFMLIIRGTFGLLKYVGKSIFDRLGDTPVTLIFLIGMSIIYLSELLTANILGITVSKVPTLLPQWAYLALAPWLHSGPMHIVQNSAMFVLFGYVIERRVDWIQFSIFVLATGYLSLYAPVAFGFGELSVGVSGVTRGFMAFFTLFHLMRFLQSGEEKVRVAVYHLVLWTVPFILLLVTGARFVGYIQPPPNTAVGAHLMGIVLGVAWFGYRVFRRRHGAVYITDIISR